MEPACARQADKRWEETTNGKENAEFGKTLYALSGDGDRKVVARVAEVATKRGVQCTPVALARVAQKPFVTAPIVGASKPHHLDDAVETLSLV